MCWLICVGKKIQYVYKYIDYAEQSWTCLFQQDMSITSNTFENSLNQ